MGKKSHRHRKQAARPKVKYQFIEEHRLEFPIRVLCEVLEVSESGYYEWRKRQPSRRQKADEELTVQLETVFEQSRQTYGSPRIHATLRGEGVSCSRRRLQWNKLNDTALTLKALQMAIAQRQPGAGVIHHSDHGSNYTSGQYRAQLAQIGAVVSHSRPGRPQENGIAESFNKTVSYEKLYLEEYQNLAEVETGLKDWMSRIYNGGRLHSSLGYQSPVEFEQNWLAQKAQPSGLVDS